MTSVRWLHRCHEAGRLEFRLGRRGDEVLAEWVGLATLRASLAGDWSELSVAPELDRVEVEESLRGHVDALLSHLRGGLSLHASSVCRGGVALAFAGDSGAGKSTIAAQLCTDPAVELLSDDSAPLRFSGPHIEVMPAETRHMLRQDVARAFGLEPEGRIKVRKDALRPAARPARLGALVTLAFDDSVRLPVLRRIHGVRAFSVLNRAAVRFVLDEPGVLRRELDMLALVAEQVPFYELVRSRSLSNLDGSAQEATLLLRSLSEPGRG